MLGESVSVSSQGVHLLQGNRDIALESRSIDLFASLGVAWLFKVVESA
jgi:hypothetical protein